MDQWSLDAIHARLAEIGRAHADRRTHYFSLRVAELVGDRCMLAGVLLDAVSRDRTVALLRTSLPDVRFDAARVRVLRTDSPRLLAVATNVAGLHAGPSFGAELLSQLVNGTVVELLRRRRDWCFVRQIDGYLGWTYRPYLTTERPEPGSLLVCAPLSALRAHPAPDADVTGRVPGGAEVGLIELSEGWARILLAGGESGWLPVSDLRRVADRPLGEAARTQMIADALAFTGTPYLWGGCTAFGIDCSGFSQLLFRHVGIAIPRDSDMQFRAGRSVDMPYAPGDLLFFGESGRITHVGVSLGGWQIAHSSRARNGVYQDDVQAVAHLRDGFVGARTFLPP